MKSLNDNEKKTDSENCDSWLTIALFILLIACIYSIVIVFLSDHSIGFKIFCSVIDAYLIFWASRAIHMF